MYVSYKCQICDSIFNKKSNYLAHISKKKKCNENTIAKKMINDHIIRSNINNKTDIFYCNSSEENLNENNLSSLMDLNNVKRVVCMYCNKSYSSNTNLNKHLKNCKSKIENDQIKILNDRIELLEKMSKETKLNNSNNNHSSINANNSNTSSLNSHSTINSNNTTTTNNIIVKFGKESIDTLTNEEKYMICTKGNGASLALIKCLHLNPKYPQYHNLFINDNRFLHAHVYNGNKFEISNTNLIIKHLVDNTSFQLDKILDSTDISKRMHERITNLIDILETGEDKEFLIDKYKEAKYLLYNNRQIIKNTHNIK